MTAGLTLPFVTAADPDRVGEGSLDPLGLARIADRLADELAPEVTARMSRARFVTAIAVASHVLGEPADIVGDDGTPAYLAFEWHVVEAFVRSRPESGTDGVPGILKARTRLREPRRHLHKESYLETPKVFGFHGVYKRLARDLELVDDHLVLLPTGEALLAVWEREQNLEGFVERRRGSAGAKFAAALAGEVRRALEKGVVQLGPTSKWWRQISASLAPRAAGPREQRRLWQWFSDTRHPVRRELAGLIASQRGSDASERKVVEGLLEGNLSAELRTRLRAVSAYEAAVRPLDDGFRLLRSVASQRTPSAVSPAEMSRHPAFQDVARALPGALARATECLEEVGLAVELETALRVFDEPLAPVQLVDAILDRHDAVQAAKGKRSWFERDGRGFLVRGIGRLDDPFAPLTEYLHPYRVYSLRSFAQDLRRS